MIDRYTTKEMQSIWSLESKFQAWFDVEIASLEALAKHNNEIPQNCAKLIKSKAKVDVARILEIEKETKHDVIAFNNQICEQLDEEKKWFHFGLTSTDIVDSANSLLIQKANLILEKALQNLHNLLLQKAQEHQNTFQIGRTHGIHAEVTTLGYKFLIWADEIERHLKRFKNVRQEIEVAKISGALGNYANLPLEVQEEVALKLNLQSAPSATQTLQRDRHANYLFTLALIAASLEKFSIEVRHLQRTEVNEVQEFFSQKQQGSSAMPHKKNPISSENITGLARMIRAYVLPGLENIALWHERDISHSSNERITLSDSTTLLHYLLIRFSNLVQNLIIHKEQMLENIFLTHGIIFSQRALLMLITKRNISRQKAYLLIQPLAFKAFQEKKDFGELLLEAKLFTQDQVKEIYDLHYYTKNLQQLFQKRFPKTTSED